MDPSGPWSYTYNRIAATTETSTSTTASSNDYQQQHLTTISGQQTVSTQQQSTVLLQATNTASVGGGGGVDAGGNTQGGGTTFNTANFVSPTSLSYDPVFNPVFHHTGGSKSTGNYTTSISSQHKQNLTQIQVATAVVEKSDNSRQNYSGHNQQQQQQHFYTEQQATSDQSSSPPTTVVTGSTLQWHTTNNSQISDPFHILTQDNSITTNAAGHQQGGIKANSYENYTNAHFTTQQQQQNVAQQLSGIKSTNQQQQRTSSPKMQQQSIPSPITVSVAPTRSNQGQQQQNQYYRQAINYNDSAVQTISKTYTGGGNNNAALNQACIVVTTTPVSQAQQNQNLGGNQKDGRSYVATKKQNLYNNGGRNNPNIEKQQISNITVSNVSGGNNVANFGIPLTAVKANNALHLVQTKAQTKIYPEFVFLEEQDREKLTEIQQQHQQQQQQSDPQDGTISYYTIIDGRLAYTTTGNPNIIINESPKGRTISNLQSPRHFVIGNSPEILTADGNRIKTEPGYTVSTLQNECTNAIIVPRKLSPSHSTSSSQAPSPAYPIYNSPMNSIESPSQHSNSGGTQHSTASDNTGHIVIYKSNTPNQTQLTATQQPMDVTVTKNATNNNNNNNNNQLTNTNSNVVYSSVITRALVNDQGKIYNPQHQQQQQQHQHHQQQQQQNWECDIKPKKFYTINSGSQNEIIVPAGINIKPAYYDPTNHNTQIGALHALKTEPDQVTESILVTTEHPLSSQIQITPKIEEQHSTQQSQPVTIASVPQQSVATVAAPAQKTRRRRNQNTSKTREQLLSENEFLINRNPGMTVTTTQQQQQETKTVVQEVPVNVTLHQQQQQQQQQHVVQALPQQQNGGTYYEFDNRWNIQKNPSSQQAQVVVSSIPQDIPAQINYVNQQQQQHQQQQQQQQQQQVLITTQHAAAPSPVHNAQVPYYPTYHITQPGTINLPESQQLIETHPNQNQLISQYQSPGPGPGAITEPTSSSSSNYNTQPCKQEPPEPQQDESILKVVVPNIEEELGFLSEEPALNKAHGAKDEKANIIRVSNPSGTGFMDSYLRFLQGEREGSPPPAARTPRKPIYHRVPIASTTTTATTNPAVNTQSTVTSTATKLDNIKTQQSIITTISNSVSSATTSSTIPHNNNITTTTTTLQPITITVQKEQQQMQQQQHQQQQQSTSNTLIKTEIQLPKNQTTSSTSTTVVQTSSLHDKKRKGFDPNETEPKKPRGRTKKNVAEIAVQTQSHPVPLPKKARPQMAMQMAAMQHSQALIQNQNVVKNIIGGQQMLQNSSVPSVSRQSTTIVTIPVTSSTISNIQNVGNIHNIGGHIQNVSNIQNVTNIHHNIGGTQTQSTQVTTTYRYQQKLDEDPLNVPPRRETSLRKAKTRGIEEIMDKKTQFDDDDPEEPQEFADSDTDPVWTPQDDDNESNKPGKRKTRKTKTSYSRSRKQTPTGAACSNILTAAVVGAGIEDSDADNVAAIVAINKRLDVIHEINKKTEVNSPKKVKQDAIRAQEALKNASGIQQPLVDNFKLGEFVVLRSDLVNEWPVIWQIDGKSILQMFEPICQNGKMFYKNMSKYAAWNNDSKRLYLRAPVRICSQNSKETVVELLKSEIFPDDSKQYVEKVMQEYLQYKENFEVFVQTLISQNLDPNFLAEITKERDDYFLTNINAIDDIMENCKRKILSITNWPRNVIASIQTWPIYNVVKELSHNHMNTIICSGCQQTGISVRLILYGQPYNYNTMEPVDPDNTINYEKNILLCRTCLTRAEILNKVFHEKYNLYQICSKKVSEQNTGKGTTAILNDLLADSNWIDQIFYNVRSSWTEVDNLARKTLLHQSQ